MPPVARELCGEDMLKLGRLFRGGGSAWPSAPDGRLIYAVGDVHGCNRLLRSLVRLIAQDAEDLRRERPDVAVTLIFLGDYIDRGPDSKAVIDLLISDDLPGDAHHFLLGNHEDVLLKFLNADTDQQARYEGERWVNYGGSATLGAYGVHSPPQGVRSDAAWRDLQGQLQRAVPTDHLRFFQALEMMVSYGDFAFVHAGVKPGLLFDEQAPHDLLWIRDEFLYDDGPLEKVVVHGHTPESSPTLTSRRIGVDTGAYATGVLSAARIWSDSVEFLQVSAA